MSYYDEDFYQEPSEFDELMEDLKANLASKVKTEISDELTLLRTENAELRDKVKNLNRLEREVAAAKRDYEQRAKNAEREAKAEAKRLSAGEMLEAIGSPKYTVTTVSVFGDKCEKCDDQREIHFTSPSGKDLTERCACHVKYVRWVIQEQIAWTAGVRDRKLMVWYARESVTRDPDRDYVYTKVLRNPAGVDLSNLMKEPYDYGFSSKDEAQKLADALNQQDEGETTAW